VHSTCAMFLSSDQSRRNPTYYAERYSGTFDLATAGLNRKISDYQRTGVVQLNLCRPAPVCLFQARQWPNGRSGPATH
jgi:hypothetical protein